MKIKITFSTFLLLSSLLSLSQNINWAVKDSFRGAYKKKIVCDKDSNVYVYAYKSLGEGSVMEKFSTNGNLLLTKNWPDTFYVNKLLYDGNQRFYFTGYFVGNVTVDGISLSSKGGMDGVVGQMDMNGTIQWMKVFGSNKDELGNWLCFGPSNNSLVITGKTTDSLIYDNTYIARNTQSTIIAQISLSGNLMSYKLHDFLPQRDNVFNGAPGLQNAGIEITNDTFGNYFLFTEREGKHSPCCSSDTLNAPEEGRYVMKLNASFDTLWTRYIIGPGCYYGWNGYGLMVSFNGDAYVLSYCSSHYGGDRIVQRLDKNTGATAWNEVHSDGGFIDIFVEGNDLYSCNIDSANYCPCPSQYEGYQDVRRIDQNNNSLVYELKFDQAQYQGKNLTFEHITRDAFGNTYVQGTFISTSIVIGPDTLYGDSAYSYTGAFLMKLSDTSFATVIKQPFASSLNIYPNPAISGNFEIFCQGKVNENMSINILDAAGRPVYNENMVLSQNELRRKINLGKNAKGLYLVEVFTKEGKIARKVMVE